MIAGRLIERTTETEPLTVVVNPTVTWNPSASPVQITLKDWNRGFELGTLLNWTAVDAEISTVSPYEGLFCCKLIGTGSKITQTLDDPVPVTGVWMFRFRARSEGTTALKPIIYYTDGTSSEGGQTIFPDEWTDVFMIRQDMNAEKIVSGFAIESSAGEIFIDDMFLGLATEIIAGAVEVGQGTPRNLQVEAVARPRGFEMDGFPKKGSVTTTANYAVVVEYTVPENWKYMLAKILVSCPEDVLYRIRWNNSAISAEVFVTGGIPFTDWFPWGYAKMWGDGIRKIDIQVKYPSGGVAATCHAELVGEYVKWAFNL